MIRLLLALLLLAGCAASIPESTTATTTMPVATAVSMPSELPPDAALMVVRYTLRRGGWPITDAGTAVTAWRPTDAGPLRLYATATEVQTDTSAFSVVLMWAEVDVGGAATPVVQDDRLDGAWAIASKAIAQVRDDVRYARY